jgi:DNA gyrase/topoisomerase IV subunit B
VSFVNSICTSKGGTHVDYLVNQISKWARQDLVNLDCARVACSGAVLQLASG